MPVPLPDGAQPQVQQRPHRGHALISPGQGAGDDGPLRHPGESQRGRGEAASGVRTVGAGHRGRDRPPSLIASICNHDPFHPLQAALSADVLISPLRNWD